ncbi:MAG: GTPase Era [Bdellovibrionaceae bacterium]|jgi:GTPase|nr:GTPase Era [Pseudobdellovibrionaceae bacterium]
MMYRTGFLGLIGQPNAGKSTLMNFLVDEKVSIVTAKPQTTRRRVLGLWSSDEGQIVFVDAPGLIRADQGLNGFLAKEAGEVIADSDALLAVVSVDEKAAEDNEKTLELVASSGKPWIGIVTKTDLGEKGHRVLILKDMIEKRKGKALSLSLKNPKSREAQEDREALLLECLALMPEAPAPLYDIELFTPESERALICEIIREKCFEHVHQEIPFGIAVRMIKFDEMAEPVPRIAVEVLVSKENHKGIVIGKAGSVLKQIGTDARKDIEKLLGQKVFLELKVSVREDWAKNQRLMKELGYAHERKS